MKPRYDLALAALAGAAAVLGVQTLQATTIRDANYCRRFADEVIANQSTDIEAAALALTLPMRKYFEQACLDPPRNHDEFIARWFDAKLAMLPPENKKP